MLNRLKKILSVALAFVLTLALLPVMSVPARAATILTNALTFTADTASVDQLASYGYKWDKNTLTLTLDGLNLTTNNATALYLPANSTISVISDSTIQGTYNGTGNTSAINVNGALTIDIATGATLTASAGTSANAGSVGVYITAASSDILKKGSGTLIATGTGSASYGICFVNGGSLIVNNGTVTAKANWAINTVPTVSASATITGSANTAGNGASTINVAQAGTSTYKYVQITAYGDALPRTSALDFTVTTLTYMSATGSKTVNLTSGNITDGLEGWAWYKNATEEYEANTLVLDGMNLTANATNVLNLPADTTIKVTGDSTILSIYNSTSEARAIRVIGALTFDVDAGVSLDVTGGAPTNNNSIAIRTVGAGNVVKKGAGTLNATSGNASLSKYSIYVDAGTFIMLDGIVNAHGTGTSGRGIYCASNAPIIYKGTITAIGETGAYSSYLTVSTGATITGSTNAAGTGATTITAAQAATNTYKYVQITAKGGAIARSSQLNFTGTNISYKSTAGSTSGIVSSNILDSIEGWKWYKTGGDGYAANTLVLDGLSLTYAGSFPLIVPADATIIVLGDSTITATSVSGVDTYAINVSGNLTIDVAADVTFSVTGGTVGGVGSSYGIRSTGNIVKKGAGTWNAKGGNVSQSPYTSRGIFADGKTFIMLDGTVNATGGTAAGGSQGIQATTAPIIYKGTVTAKGKSTAFYNVPIIGTGAAILGSSDYNGASPVPAEITASQAGTSTYKYVQITATGGALPRTSALDFSVNTVSLTYISATGSKTVNPTSGNITDSLEGWAWYKSSASGYSSNTLVLDGINLSTSAATALKLPAESMVILAENSENTVKSTYTASDCRSVHGVGALTIDGTGTLNAASANVSSGSNASYPINVTGGLTINNGIINAIAGTSTGAANGISVHGGLTVNGGVITASAGNGAAANNHGINVNSGGFLMTGGTVIAASGTSSGAKYGINVGEGGFFTMTGGELYAKGASGGNAMGVTGTVTGNLEILGGSGGVGGTYNTPAKFNTASPKVIVAATGGASILDAKIAVKTYTITLDQQGGSGGTPGVSASLEGELPDITAPTRDNYTFGGYYTSTNGGGTQYYNEYGISLRAWDQTDDITLYALWTRNEKATEINDTTTDDGFTVIGSNLDEVIDRIVTAADTAGGNKVTLALNVSDNANQAEAEGIKQIAGKNGDVYFFDVTLTKSVDNSGSVTNTNLTNISVPIEVHIKLKDELAGRTYYRVYRYHDGKAEQISSDTSRAEHYTVDVANSEIIIRTMKFSTYAIFGNDAPIDLGTGYDVDVQAKITGTGGAIYKIDLAWGAMTFEYSTSGVWNPDTHSYDGGTTVGWRDEGFMYGNNQITAWNHSNSDVEANFTITQPSLTGVTMEINRSNVLGGIAAENMELSRVPGEGEAAPSIDAFLLLDGEPDDVTNALNASYSKIAVITVTIEAVAGSGLTPKNP